MKRTLIDCIDEFIRWSVGGSLERAVLSMWTVVEVTTSIVYLFMLPIMNQRLELSQNDNLYIVLGTQAILSSVILVNYAVHKIVRTWV